jgi:hypothetical protein
MERNKDVRRRTRMKATLIGLSQEIRSIIANKQQTNNRVLTG